MLEPHKDAIRIGKNAGPSITLTVQLQSEESDWVFEDELSAFLTLLFERWSPPDQNKQPMTNPAALARNLAPTWSRKDPEVTPVGALTGAVWMRLDQDTWPVNIVDREGRAHLAEVWPVDGQARHDAPRWIRLKKSTPALVDLRIRANDRTPGKIHADISLHADLYAPLPDREPSEALMERSGCHLVSLTQWIEDMVVLYQPAPFEVKGPAILSGATISIQGATSNQRVAARLFERIHELNKSTEKNAKANPEKTRVLEIWMRRMDLTGEPPPEFVNARTLLDGLASK